MILYQKSGTRVTQNITRSPGRFGQSDKTIQYKKVPLGHSNFIRVVSGLDQH